MLTVRKIGVRNLEYLKNIQVIYCSDNISKPDDSVVEINGKSADINRGFCGKFVYLVPEWTPDPVEAVTSMEIIIQHCGNSKFQDMAKGSCGPHRYLKLIRNQTASTRVGEIKLFRAKDESANPNGYLHTRDINKGRGKDYLYLCWKNISLDQGSMDVMNQSEVTGAMNYACDEQFSPSSNHQSTVVNFNNRRNPGVTVVTEDIFKQGQGFELHD